MLTIEGYGKPRLVQEPNLAQTTSFGPNPGFIEPKASLPTRFEPGEPINAAPGWLQSS